MAKPIQQHASFCTCAECIHRALHPSVPQIAADVVVVDVDEKAHDKPHWANDERERFERERQQFIEEDLLLDVDGHPVKVGPV